MSKQYHIPVRWESYKRYTVEADNLQKAVEKALTQFLDEPDEYYISDSFEVDEIIFEEVEEDFDLNQAFNKVYNE